MRQIHFDAIYLKEGNSGQRVSRIEQTRQNDYHIQNKVRTQEMQPEQSGNETLLEQLVQKKH